jgi:hypothetical protein
MSHLSNETWGAWSLGDLGALLTKVAGLLGPAQEVSSVALIPPEGRLALPGVTIAVNAEVVAERLLHQLLCSDSIVDLQRPLVGADWTAAVDGCIVSVELEPAANEE